MATAFAVPASSFAATYKAPPEVTNGKPFKLAAQPPAAAVPPLMISAVISSVIGLYNSVHEVFQSQKRKQKIFHAK